MRPRALTRLREQHDYYALRGAGSFAEARLEEFFGLLDTLRRHPYFGHRDARLSTPNAEMRRVVLQKSFAVLYYIDIPAQIITVLDYLDVRQATYRPEL